ncbi:MAG: acyltransferase family protein [Novosphingobium sp.]
MQHRAEIEGLRAVAVVPVVLFHAGIAGLGGGFVGVDVFFVISGYLITRAILADAQEHRFSLRGFYERRARRILPALFPVLLASLALAWLVMIPPDFRQFSQSLGASALFAANLLFAHKTGYFDDDEGFAPLLHLWSLSVEEQFYILFPLLVLMLLRIAPPERRHMLLAASFALLALASLALALAMPADQSSLAFFLLPARAWELLVGALCAVLPDSSNGQPAAIRSAQALAGLALVVAGMMISSGMQAPDWRLLLPVGGTALVLRHASAGNLAGRILGLPVLTSIGAASYGIYLWHNPLLATLDYVWLDAPPLWLSASAIGLATALGFASLHLLERPVRQRVLLRDARALATFCALALALALTAGIAGHLRWLQPRSIIAAKALGAHPPPGEAQGIILPDKGAPLAFIVYGDSHARQYFPALQARFGKGALLTVPGCLSLPQITSRNEESERAETCAILPQELARQVRERQIPVVIWAQRWDRELYDKASLHLLGQASGAAWPGMQQGIEQLRASLPPATRLILVGNVPTAAAGGPALSGGYARCLAYLDIHCPVSYPAERAEGHRINPMLASVATRLPQTFYFDPTLDLCDAAGCAVMRDGKVIYHDWTHLSEYGAGLVARRLGDEFLAR